MTPQEAIQILKRSGMSKAEVYSLVDSAFKRVRPKCKKCGSERFTEEARYFQDRPGVAGFSEQFSFAFTILCVDCSEKPVDTLVFQSVNEETKKELMKLITTFLYQDTYESAEEMLRAISDHVLAIQMRQEKEFYRFG